MTLPSPSSAASQPASAPAAPAQPAPSASAAAQGTPPPAAPPAAMATPAPLQAPASKPAATVAKSPEAPAASAAQSSVHTEIAGPARLRLRHNIIALTFIGVVVIPVLACIFYLWLLARDQYHSTVSFSVQVENGQSASSLLSGLTQLAGATSSAADQEILFQYIQSQDLVAELDQKIDLRKVYSRNWPSDPLFAFNPKGSIEDLHKFWLRNIDIGQDANGLMTVLVRAPTAEEAQRLSQTVFDLASVLINRIAAATRDDSLRYSRQELSVAEQRLTAARQDLTGFRLKSQIVDPAVDLQGQMSILNGLQTELVAITIELDKLRSSTIADDPRLSQTLQRKKATERQIEIERRKFGEGGLGPGGENFATLFSEYERLSANLQFAETAYQAAAGSYDAVLALTARQSRYLVAHVRPTLAERALYPNRSVITALFAGFALLIWAVGVLIFYSVRDRR